MYSDLIATLQATGIPFAEVAWNNAPPSGSYGVIQLDSAADTVWADGKCEAQALEGSVDLFVRGKGLTDMIAVQTAFETAGVSWHFNSCAYEPARKLMHYEWVFQLEAI